MPNTPLLQGPRILGLTLKNSVAAKSYYAIKANLWGSHHIKTTPLLRDFYIWITTNSDFIIPTINRLSGYPHSPN